MCIISWEPTQRRLRLAGPCDDQDRDAVQAALASCGEGRVLIVDLTAVTSLAPRVAEVIIAARDRNTECRVTVLRRKNSAAEQVLTATEMR
jgi:hypothetical protein